MGVVCLVHNTALHPRYGLKLLSPVRSLNDVDDIDRIETEARAARRWCILMGSGHTQLESFKNVTTRRWNLHRADAAT